MVFLKGPVVWLQRVAAEQSKPRERCHSDIRQVLYIYIYNYTYGVSKAPRPGCWINLVAVRNLVIYRFVRLFMFTFCPYLLNLVNYLGMFQNVAVTIYIYLSIRVKIHQNSVSASIYYSSWQPRIRFL